MYHDPGAVIFAWIFTGLIVLLIFVIIRNIKDMDTKHNLSDAHCHHSNLDSK